MPRHSGSHGVWHQTSSKGGSSRRTRTPKNTYHAKQSRRAAEYEELLAVAMGRHGGSSSGSSTPQKPKDTVKGGSKPVGGKGK